MGVKIVPRSPNLEKKLSDPSFQKRAIAQVESARPMKTGGKVRKVAKAVVKVKAKTVTKKKK